MDESFVPPRKKSPRTPPPAWEQALRWLDAKWYSEARMAERLAEKGYPADEIARVMNDLRRYGLLNDAALASEFAKSQSRRGRGSRRIRMELRQHGLRGEAAENALAEIAPQEEESARNALAGKLRSWAGEPDWRRRRDKAFRFLAGRGYSLDVVRRTIEAEPGLQYDGGAMEDCGGNFDTGWEEEDAGDV